MVFALFVGFFLHSEVLKVAKGGCKGGCFFFFLRFIVFVVVVDYGFCSCC